MESFKSNSKQNMDVEFVTQYFKERKVQFNQLNGDVILGSLQRIEYQEIEEIKDELFRKKIRLFCFSKMLKRKDAFRE